MTHFKYNTTQKCTKYIKLIVKQYNEIGMEYANTKNPYNNNIYIYVYINRQNLKKIQLEFEIRI